MLRSKTENILFKGWTDGTIGLAHGLEDNKKNMNSLQVGLGVGEMGKGRSKEGRCRVKCELFNMQWKVYNTSILYDITYVVYQHLSYMWTRVIWLEL